MRKYSIIGGFLVFVIILVVIAWFIRPASDEAEITPSPTPLEPQAQLLDSVPKDGATDVKLTQEIVLSFSEPVTKNDLKILAGPEIELFEAFRGKTVIVRPRGQWTSGIENRITIQYADLSRIPDSFTFTTIGEAPESLPDTAPNPTQIQQSEQFQIDSAPDVYLSNFTPYETETFSVSSEYKDAPTGHFAFAVQMKQGSRSEVQVAVEQWVRSHGLTETQRKSLDISYL